MGNAVSGQQNNGEEVFSSEKIARDTLRKEVFNDFKRVCNPIDMIQISRNLPFSKDNTKVNETITKEQLFKVLNIPFDNKFLWNFIKVCTNWPTFSNMKDIDETISLKELIVCYVLLGHGIDKLNLKIPLVKLVWLSLTKFDRPEGSNDDTTDVIVDSRNRIQWHLLPIVQSFDEIEMEDVEKGRFSDMLKALLPLLCKSDDEINSVELNETNFKSSIKSILDTLFSYKASLAFEQFEQSLLSYMPRLLEPLHSILDPITRQELKMCDISNLKRCKIMTVPVFSQLNTFRICDKNVMMLYVGSQMGFSIRSLQTHIFKYRAPTLVLLKGRIQLNFDKYKSPFFKTFPKSINEKSDGNVASNGNGKYIVLGIYVEEPWQISNTKSFSNGSCEVYEFQPKQAVTKLPITQGGAYFSTLGSGLGVGSRTPPTKSKVGSQGMKFGDKLDGSITIDNSLEVGNFRKAGEDLWFKVVEVEVYGMGGIEERKEQEAQWEWERREAERRKYVGDVAEGRALLELAGIIGHSESGGSI